MTSRNLSAYKPDDVWEAPDGTCTTVEVLKTSSMRDVRDALLSLAYLLYGQPERNSAVCVVVESRLTVQTLADELERFRAVVSPDISSRVHFLVRRKAGVPRFAGSLDLCASAVDFTSWLAATVEREAAGSFTLQLPARQVVIAALAHFRVSNEPPVTIKKLQDVCRVSYPTVAAVIRKLEERGWLEAADERGVRLRPLADDEWMELAQDHARLRKTYEFTDPTGTSSPEQLVKRLARLQKDAKLPRSVRVGGVIGASRHFPDLDITAPLRLDLSIETDPSNVAAMLDAALQPKRKPEEKVAVALHVTRDDLFFRSNNIEADWASELECLADLVEIGYTREAREMAMHLEQANTQEFTV